MAQPQQTYPQFLRFVKTDNRSSSIQTGAAASVDPVPDVEDNNDPSTVEVAERVADILQNISVVNQEGGKRKPNPKLLKYTDTLEKIKGKLGMKSASVTNLYPVHVLIRLIREKSLKADPSVDYFKMYDDIWEEVKSGRADSLWRQLKSDFDSNADAFRKKYKKKA